MKLRHALSWKALFYGILLPLLRRLGPAASDAVLRALGPMLSASRPRLRRAAAEALAASRASPAPGRDAAALLANLPRFTARDYLLDGRADADLSSRFDVSGLDALRSSLASGDGAILVGSHLGGYLSALHYLYRAGLPLRLSVQRPRHVSAELHRRFDLPGPHPQSDLFLRRGLPPREAVDRMLRARAALRDGLAVYFSGDIPWPGPNARPGRLLGRDRLLLSVWADLAAMTGSPVFACTCLHRPGGRFRLILEPFGAVLPGDESAAVARFARGLDAAIAANPADAAAHLLWPCYADAAGRVAKARPIFLAPRRNSAACEHPG